MKIFSLGVFWIFWKRETYCPVWHVKIRDTLFQKLLCSIFFSNRLNVSKDGLVNSFLHRKPQFNVFLFVIEKGGLTKIRIDVQTFCNNQYLITIRDDDIKPQASKQTSHALSFSLIYDVSCSVSTQNFEPWVNQFLVNKRSGVNPHWNFWHF